MVLRSTSRGLDGRTTTGTATQWNYGSSSRRYDLYTQFEHYDRDFQMDTAFYNRTGFTSGWVFGALSFYPSKDRLPWLRRVVPFTFTQGGRDRVQGGDDLLNVTGVRMHLSRQGFVRVHRTWGREPWRARRFRIGQTQVNGNIQALRWLRLGGGAAGGYATYYDDVDPFQGWSRTRWLDVVLQPGPRWTQQVSWQHVDFDRHGTRADVYDLTILNTRTTYQFSRRMFSRGIVQYDSQRRRVLVDLLQSYELRPGTVLFAGYGSLLEERTTAGETWTSGPGRYYGTRRGVFLKASYLHRF
jgi:hypothetical protein